MQRLSFATIDSSPTLILLGVRTGQPSSISHEQSPEARKEPTVSHQIRLRSACDVISQNARTGDNQNEI